MTTPLERAVNAFNTFFNVNKDLINEIKEVEQKTPADIDKQSIHVVKETFDLLSELKTTCELEVKIKLLPLHAEIDNIVEQCKILDIQCEEFRRKANATPIKTIMNDVEQLQKEMLRKLDILQKELEPEIAKTQELITGWEKMKQFIQNQDPDQKEIQTFSDLIDQEVSDLKKELDDYYQVIMVATKTQRYEAADFMQRVTASDFKSRSLSKMIKLFYEIGAKLNKPPAEIDSEVRAMFKLNEVKNDFFESVADFIKEPKETIQAGIEKLIREFKEKKS
jgi:hypothetical protein